MCAHLVGICKLDASGNPTYTVVSGNQVSLGKVNGVELPVCSGPGTGGTAACEGTGYNNYGRVASESYCPAGKFQVCHTMGTNTVSPSTSSTISTLLAEFWYLYLTVVIMVILTGDAGLCNKDTGSHDRQTARY